MKPTSIQIEELKAWLDGNECPYWLQYYASTKWADSIPYGTLTGDTGTVDEWLSDHVDWVVDEFSEYLPEEKINGINK